MRLHWAADVQSKFAQEKAQDEKRLFKRRGDSTDEDLRKQLQLIPDVGFDQGGAAMLLNSLKAAKMPAAIPPDFGLRFYTQLSVQFKRPDWLALPWQKGLEPQLVPDPR